MQQDNPGFDATGFATTGNTYYTYQVSTAGGTIMVNIAGTGISGSTDAFYATAAGNLDDLAGNSEFGYSSSIAIMTTSPSVVNNVTQNSIFQDINPGVY